MLGIVWMGAPPRAFRLHHRDPALVGVMPKFLKDAQRHGLVLYNPEPHFRGPLDDVAPGFFSCVLVSRAAVSAGSLLVRRRTNSSADSITMASLHTPAQ
jgi:hypothetical protein